MEAVCRICGDEAVKQPQIFSQTATSARTTLKMSLQPNPQHPMTSSALAADSSAKLAPRFKAAGIHRIVLETQAFHIPRAQRLFTAGGLEVVVAPTDFKGQRRQPLGLFDWLPQAKAVQTSYYAEHEWLGLAWLWLSQR